MSEPTREATFSSSSVIQLSPPSIRLAASLSHPESRVASDHRVMQNARQYPMRKCQNRDIACDPEPTQGFSQCLGSPTCRAGSNQNGQQGRGPTRSSTNTDRQTASVPTFVECHPLFESTGVAGSQVSPIPFRAERPAWGQGLQRPGSAFIRPTSDEKATRPPLALHGNRIQCRL